jgi:uncharacterized protein YcfL
MRRLLAVLMTALMVTSAVGAGMVLGAPAMPVEESDLNIISDGVDDTDDVSVYRAVNDGDESVQVTVDVYGTSMSKTFTLGAGETKQVVFDGAGDKTVRLLYNGNVADTTATNPKEAFYVDTQKITLTSMGADSEDDLAEFRVRNDNDEDVTVSWDVYGTDQSGELTVGAGEESFFLVNTSDDGSATVRLFYENEQVDVKAAGGEQDLGPLNVATVDEGILLTGICSDSEDGLSQMRVRSTLEENVTLSYRVAGSDETGTVEAVAGEDVFFDVETSGPTTVVLQYKGENVETKNANTNSECDLGEPNVDTEAITLTAICTDTEDDLAKFRVTNDNDAAVTVTYDVYGTDQEGTLTLNASETKYFTVETNDDGAATARLFYENEQIDVKASNTQRDCDLGEPNVDTDDLTLTSICSVDGEAKFRVTNDNDTPVTVSYDKYGTDVEGELTVDANGKAYFTVPENDDGATTVRLFYEGEEITVKAASGTPCEAPDDGDDGMDDGDDSDGDDGQDGDMDDGTDVPAYQIDVAAGGVIENLGVDGDDADDEADFYGTQGRLLQAQTVLANGTVTGTHKVPTENVTKSLADCEVTYTPVSYDAATGQAELTVSVDGDADCENVTLTLAGYELPGDDTTFVRENADGQELVDSVTVTLEPGQSGTVTIDLDDAEA